MLDIIIIAGLLLVAIGFSLWIYIEHRKKLKNR